MLIRSSISITKKFFQKTLGNLKGFFSVGSYEKLPKSPAFPYAAATTTTTSAVDMNLHTTSYRDLDRFYTDFADQWDSKIQRTRSNNKKLVSSPTKLQDHTEDQTPTSFTKLNASNASPAKINYGIQERREGKINYGIQERREGKIKAFSKESRVVGRGCLVAEKLKELEKLDMSNVDHVLDIEEVLHYYSRLTCPAYLEIVDKFFMEMYAEFFRPSAASPARSTNSRLRPRSVRS